MVRALLVLLLAFEARAEWVAGARAGVAFPRELDPCLVVGIEAGRYFGPVGVLAAAELEQPSGEVHGTDPGVGAYAARLTRRTFSTSLRLAGRVELPDATPYAAVGARLVVASLRSNGAAGAQPFGESVDTRVEPAVELSAGARLGPFVGEFLFYRGEETGAVELRVGYAFTF
ncbi:MAG TPA: hypothetical protein VKE22_12580 [Haliangiales bacterium]|nr:hypothetical protein [Haliangiales bacterium]